MAGSIYIGIDLGTTVLKVAAYAGADGRRLGSAERRLPLRMTDDGGREQEPAAIARALDGAMRLLRRELGEADWARVGGIGLAAQGGSTILCDRDGGKPLTPMYLWNDFRCFPWFVRIAAMRPAAHWRRFSLRDEPGVGLGRIAWLRERRPELFVPGLIYVGAGEYVYHSMTGHWRQDACHALQTGCYDARRGTLAGQPLALVGWSTDEVAPLREGHATHALLPAAAGRWGLKPGLPVAGPYNDHEAGYLAAAHVSAAPLQASLGTAWVGNFIVGPGVEGRQPFQLAVPAPAGSGRLTIQPLLTGNVTWDWALTTWLGADHKRALARQAEIFEERLLPPAGLMALPWLNRPNPILEGAAGGAAIFGLGPTSGHEDLLRAVAGGMCHEFARMFAGVVEAGLVDSIVLGGGASKGIQFRQMVAALHPSLPVYQAVEDDAGTRGCLWPLSRRIARAAVRRVPLSRGLDRDAITRAHGLYLDLYGRLYGHVAAGRPYAVRAGRTR